MGQINHLHSPVSAKFNTGERLRAKLPPQLIVKTYVCGCPLKPANVLCASCPEPPMTKSLTTTLLVPGKTFRPICFTNEKENGRNEERLYWQDLFLSKTQGTKTISITRPRSLAPQCFRTLL